MQQHDASKRSSVHLTFDERSLVSWDDIKKSGLWQVREIPVTIPLTEEEKTIRRVLWIPFLATEGPRDDSSSASP